MPPTAETQSSPSNIAVIVPRKLTNPTTSLAGGTSACKESAYCLALDSTHRNALADAFISDAIDALPIKPDRITDVNGPFLELRRVDNQPDTVNVSVTHQFNAHFSSTSTLNNGTSIRHSVATTTTTTEDTNKTTKISGTGSADEAAAVTFKNDGTVLIEEVPPSHSEPSQPSSIATTTTTTTTNEDTSKAACNNVELALALPCGTVQNNSNNNNNNSNNNNNNNNNHHPTKSRSNQTTTTAMAAAAAASSISSWQVDPRDVSIGRRLAVGGFGEVFVGSLHGTVVAVKVLLNVDDAAKERFMREVSVMASLRHPSVVLFMGFTSKPHLAILSEYMPRGSLFKVLRSGGDAPLQPRLQRSVAISVARGMAYLHTRTPHPLLHLDLKSPNVLVDDRWRIKIADFGLSRLRFNTFLTGGHFGTSEWMAPEVLRSEGCTEHADVYSYGVILWECLTGKAPWEGMHPMQVVGAVGFQGQSLPLDFPPGTDTFLMDLCTRCLSHTPTDRPLFPQIVHELEMRYSPQTEQSMHSRLSDSGASLGLLSSSNSTTTFDEIDRYLPHPQVQAADAVLAELPFAAPPPPRRGLPPDGTATVSPFAAAAAAIAVDDEEEDDQSVHLPLLYPQKRTVPSTIANQSPFGAFAHRGFSSDSPVAFTAAAGAAGAGVDAGISAFTQASTIDNNANDTSTYDNCGGGEGGRNLPKSSSSHLVDATTNTNTNTNTSYQDKINTTSQDPHPYQHHHHHCHHDDLLHTVRLSDASDAATDPAYENATPEQSVSLDGPTLEDLDDASVRWNPLTRGNSPRSRSLTEVRTNDGDVQLGGEGLIGGDGGGDSSSVDLLVAALDSAQL